MTDKPVIWLRPRAQPAYTDTAALNDIHTLLTAGTGGEHAVLCDIGLILARSGRPMVPVRDIDATVTDTPAGRPVARVISNGTTITIRQEPAGPGLLTEITTSTTDGSDVTVNLDGRRCLHHPPPGGHIT